MGSVTKTEDRASRLQELESRMEQWIESTWKMAAALKEIKEDELWRETHDTWAKYCENRWGITQGWASALLTATSVRQEMGRLYPNKEIPTVSHAVRLREVPEEDRAEVWDRATERARDKGKDIPSVHTDLRPAIAEYKESKANGRPEPSPAELAHDAAENMWHAAEAFVTSVERLIPHLDSLPDDEAQGCAYKVAETVHAALEVLRDEGVLDPSVMRGLLDVPSGGREIRVP